MSLGQYFTCAHKQIHFEGGPLGKSLDGFHEWLVSNAFSFKLIRRTLPHINHWSWYLEHHDFPETGCLSDAIVNDFLKRHLSQCRNRAGLPYSETEVPRAINKFQSYLEEIHSPLLPKPEVARYQKLIDDYCRWLKEEKEASEGTINQRKPYLTTFLKTGSFSQEDLKWLSSEKVESFFLEYAREHGPETRHAMQSTLRMFFRFCLSAGYVAQDLSLSIPTLRTYRLSRVPYGIEPHDAEKLIASINTSTRAGVRDRAMILMLHTYGIRGVQVRRLQIEDIDWRKEVIHFRSAKRGKDVDEPLTESVGDSLLRYLVEKRPKSSSKVVFLTSRAPYCPLEKGCLTQMVRTRCLAANLKLSKWGSHIFRHGFATQALAQGESLKTIADMLGHRCIGTTFQYTKVDFQALNRVALPWPEVME